jgi:hypothetical protein
MGFHELSIFTNKNREMFSSPTRCRLQNRKLLANLQNTEGWQISTLEYFVHLPWETEKPSKLEKYLPHEVYMDIQRPEKRQHRDTHDRSSVLSTPQWAVQFRETP